VFSASMRCVELASRSTSLSHNLSRCLACMPTWSSSQFRCPVRIGSD
jgi:hypothetical protein